MSERAPVTKVVFLDIDGVLLTDTDWKLEDNMRARQRLRGAISGHEDIYLESVRFSSSAITLLNQLCCCAPARIVLMTSWRWSYASDVIREILEAKGVEPPYWHDDYACTVVERQRGLRDMSRGKRRDVDEWLSRHPEVTHWVALEDEASSEGFLSLGIDPACGFDMRAYRIAAMMLDPRLSSDLTIIDEDVVEMLRAAGLQTHDYEVAAWLETPALGPGTEPCSIMRRKVGWAEGARAAIDAEFRERLRLWLESRRPIDDD